MKNFLILGVLLVIGCQCEPQVISEEVRPTMDCVSYKLTGDRPVVILYKCTDGEETCFVTDGGYGGGISCKSAWLNHEVYNSESESL